MAVFTEVSPAEAAALLQRLAAGTLESLVGIGSGIENTNYFADTTDGRFVITVFERLSRSELPFYLELMRHLSERGLPVPCPLAAASGELLHTLAGKPAAVAPRLPGAPLQQPSEAQCRRLASTLARLHLAGRDYARTQANPRGLRFWQQSAAWLPQHLDVEARELLATELRHQETIVRGSAYAALPRGAIHADLFRDNVLFEADQPTGILDFYFACTDAFLYDIAVCLNDWCTPADGTLDLQLAAAFINAYSTVRALLPQERELLPDLLRAAALRFWISRLTDIHAPRDASLLQPKDPTQFQRILQLRAAAPWHS
jgi:homoserine kinase type II